MDLCANAARYARARVGKQSRAWWQSRGEYGDGYLFFIVTQSQSTHIENAERRFGGNLHNFKRHLRNTWVNFVANIYNF